MFGLNPPGLAVYLYRAEQLVFLYQLQPTHSI